MTTPLPIGSITSLNASLTVVLFDAQAAAEWIPTRPAATKAMFTGHPAEVMRGLGKGEEFTAVDVGPSSGVAFELEGKSGQLEVYRLDDGTLALVAPPRAWWQAHGSDAEIDTLFAAALTLDAATDDDAAEFGELELTSGKLATVYLWHKKVGTARDLAATMPADGALAFGDGYGDNSSGLLVDLGVGNFMLRRREFTAPWAADQALVVVYIARDR